MFIFLVGQKEQRKGIGLTMILPVSNIQMLTPYVRPDGQDRTDDDPRHVIHITEVGIFYSYYYKEFQELSEAIAYLDDISDQLVTEGSVTLGRLCLNKLQVKNEN